MAAVSRKAWRKALWVGAGIALLGTMAAYLHFDLGQMLTLQQLQAIAVRQTPVKDQRLVGHLREGGPGGTDAVGDVDGDAAGRQPLADQPRKPLMVLDQNTPMK